MPRILKKLQILAKEHPLLPVLGVFLLAFCYFFYLQYTPAFPDPDSFYHAKIAELFSEGKFVKNFPWLSDYTVLGEYYTDQHFLYHVFLIPFVKVFGSIIGIKIATIFLAAALLSVFYWCLKQWGARFPFFYVLILAFSNPFIFRISLAKAPSVSIMFLLLALHFIFKKKYRHLFALSFVYVWTYGGFPLLLVMVGAYAFVDLLYDAFSRRIRKIYKFFQRFQRSSPWERVKNSKYARLLLSAGLGILLGIIVNPYFPKNLSYLWYQFFQIGIINYQNVIGVGGEWYPYKISNLIPATVFLSLILLIAIPLFILFFRQQGKKTKTLFILFVFFLLLTLKSRRYVEYYIPFGTLFAALAISGAFKRYSPEKIWQRLGRLYFREKIIATFLVVYILVTIPTIIIRDVGSTRGDFENGIPYTKYKNSSAWLEQNTEKGSLVLHSDWDDFPVLFFHNDHNRYIVGLDPTFMYTHGEKHYWEWVNITTGQEDRDKVYGIIKEDFPGAYVFVEKDHQEMNRLFKDNEKFEHIFEDEEAIIYKPREL